jgi:hypothetical protein
MVANIHSQDNAGQHLATNKPRGLANLSSIWTLQQAKRLWICTHCKHSQYLPNGHYGEISEHSNLSGSIGFTFSKRGILQGSPQPHVLNRSTVTADKHYNERQPSKIIQQHARQTKLRWKKWILNLNYYDTISLS